MAGRDTMAGEANDEHDKARRFRDAALPHLDDVFTLARYLMRNPADAEDAVQECYLRALRHFDSYRGPAMKPWLLAILRNVCNAEFARRGRQETPADLADDGEAEATPPIWQEPQASPETALLAPAGWRYHPPARCRAAAAVSRGHCACGRSTICLITRSPRSQASRWEP